MELAFREVEGDVKSVQLLRTTPPPTVITEADEQQ
jgi:hypothetical protein